MASKTKSSKAGKKKKKPATLRYKLENHYEKNKVRKLRKHLRKFPNDGCALNAAKLASAALGKTFVA